MDIHTGPRPGCISGITLLHAGYYARTAGFGIPFEARVAHELADFCMAFDAARDGLWLALDNSGTVQASIAIDGSHGADSGAHLRWFIASDAARGSGLGRRLLTNALAFCDSQAYSRVFLWTFEGLAAARHLYEQTGFVLTHQQIGRHWGKEVNEQRFERNRSSPLG